MPLSTHTPSRRERRPPAHKQQILGVEGIDNLSVQVVELEWDVEI